jgi:integrase
LGLPFSAGTYSSKSQGVHFRNWHSAAIVSVFVFTTPLFEQFAEDWYRTKSVEWRRSYQASVRHILDKHLLPPLGTLRLGQVDRACILDLRSKLAAGTTKGLSPATTNRIVGILSMILDESALRLSIPNPCASIKRLKVQRGDIQPFTMDEVGLMIRSVRTDYSDYLLVRFFTGMRSGEANGLKWEYVDFERREIRVRETYVYGRTEYTKTDGSQREIQMSQPVYEAMVRMQSRTGALGQYVFCSRNGLPIDNHNFVNRVWNPLLRHLGLKKRRPDQMRHTCATLWLGAGENPEWIARQLGHTTTEMLFRVYSRFVPNLTRRDGSAFDRFVSGALTNAPAANDFYITAQETRHG